MIMVIRSKMMSTAQNVEVIREIFGAVERRDQERFAQFCTSDIELHWPQIASVLEASRAAA